MFVNKKLTGMKHVFFQLLSVRAGFIPDHIHNSQRILLLLYQKRDGITEWMMYESGSFRTLPSGVKVRGFASPDTIRLRAKNSYNSFFLLTPAVSKLFIVQIVQLGFRVASFRGSSESPPGLIQHPAGFQNRASGTRRSSAGCRWWYRRQSFSRPRPGRFPCSSR